MLALRTGRMRDDDALRTMSVDGQRNTLIVEMDSETHRGSRLQGLSNLDLALTALGSERT